MADSNPTVYDPSGLPDAAAKDVHMEFVVLTYLLDEHPAQLTIAELSRALDAEPDGFDDRDAVQRAVRELAGAGLLHRHGEFVLPTRAARYFERLSEEQ